MPDERAMIARARDYLRELSQGNDPMTGRPITPQSELDEARLKRCFAFVAAYLDRDLARRANEQEIYFPTPEQARNICSVEDIPATEFYDRLARAAIAAGKMPVSARQINHFLLRAGLIEARVDSVFVERKVLRANERSEEAGIYDKPCLSPRTGAMMHTLMLSPETQRWLLRILPDLLESERKEQQEHDGYPDLI